jgi:hypothetical protein
MSRTLLTVLQRKVSLTRRSDPGVQRLRVHFVAYDIAAERIERPGQPYNRVRAIPLSTGRLSIGRRGVIHPKPSCDDARKLCTPADDVNTLNVPSDIHGLGNELVCLYHGRPSQASGALRSGAGGNIVR